MKEEYISLKYGTKQRPIILRTCSLFMSFSKTIYNKRKYNNNKEEKENKFW